MTSVSRAQTSADPAAPSARLGIDVVSDVVCPWCFIGKRRLEAAVEQAAQPVEIRWRPFQLDPTIPAIGLDRRSYLAKKFGSLEKVDTIHERLIEAGKQVGIAFAFDRIERSPNTIDAHRLIRWSAAAGAQGTVVEALFRTYFVEGRDIGDPKILVQLAGSCGMDGTLVHRLLASGSDTEAVREEIATAVRLGVSGVPFFIFAGKYAVPGAQSAEVLAAAIAKAHADEPTTAEA